jgi:hypothetical protein
MWLSIVAALFWPVAIVVLIVYLVRRGKRSGTPVAVCKEDAISQWFLLLAVFFLGVTLLAFNKDFGGLVSWRTVILLATVIGFGVAYYFKATATLIFSLLSVLVWWGAQAAAWVDYGKNINSVGVFSGMVFLMVIFYGLGHSHMGIKKWKKFAVVYEILGVIFVTGVMFLMSSKLGLTLVENMTKGTMGTWQLTIGAMVLWLLAIGSGIYAFLKKLMSGFELAAMVVIAMIFGGMLLLPRQYLTSYENLTADGFFWAVVFNIGVFAELLGLIFSGYVRRETWLINLGAFFLSLLIVVKYFDWFFSFLDKSVFFIGAGILMFGVGWFMEKGRRLMIAKIKDQNI